MKIVLQIMFIEVLENTTHLIPINVFTLVLQPISSQMKFFFFFLKDGVGVPCNCCFNLV